MNALFTDMLIYYVANIYIVALIMLTIYGLNINIPSYFNYALC